MNAKNCDEIDKRFMIKCRIATSNIYIVHYTQSFMFSTVYQ